MKVELQWLQPEVGTAIMASLSDPDGGITDNDVGMGVDALAKVTNPKISTPTATGELPPEPGMMQPLILRMPTTRASCCGR